MAGEHNDRYHNAESRANLFAQQGDQASYLAYQSALYHHNYPPHYDLTATSRPIANIFSHPYSNYDVESNLAVPTIPVHPHGYSAFGLSSSLFYGVPAPYHVPLDHGASALLGPGLQALTPPFYPSIYDLDNESKFSVECPLPADLSTKSRTNAHASYAVTPVIKSEETDSSCARKKRPTKTRTVDGKKVSRTETCVKEENNNSHNNSDCNEHNVIDDENNNKNRNPLIEAADSAAKNSTVNLKIGDRNDQLSSYGPRDGSRLPLTDKKVDSLFPKKPSHVPNSGDNFSHSRIARPDPAIELCDRIVHAAVDSVAPYERPLTDYENNSSKGVAKTISVYEKSPSTICTREALSPLNLSETDRPDKPLHQLINFEHKPDVNKPDRLNDVDRNNVRHSNIQPRETHDDIVMFPLVRNVSRDHSNSATSSSSTSPLPSSSGKKSQQPIISTATPPIRHGPNTTLATSAARPYSGYSTFIADAPSKRVHAPTFTPEITIPKRSGSKPTTTPPPICKASLSTASKDLKKDHLQKGGKRVFATTFTPEIAPQLSPSSKLIASKTDAKAAAVETQTTSVVSNERKFRSSSTPSLTWPVIKSAKLEKRRFVGKVESPPDKKMKTDTVWGSRTLGSPVRLQTPRETGKLRLAVDWKAAILGTSLRKPMNSSEDSVSVTSRRCSDDRNCESSYGDGDELNDSLKEENKPSCSQEGTGALKYSCTNVISSPSTSFVKHEEQQPHRHCDDKQTDSKQTKQNDGGQRQEPAVCMKREMKTSCLKDDIRPLSKTGNNNIPIGIAVARQRIDRTTSHPETKSAPTYPPTSGGAANVNNATHDREQFLREQRELLSPHNKPLTLPSSTTSHDIKPDITTSMIVAGGTGLVHGPWSRDAEQRGLLTTSHHWFQPTTSQAALAPTYWLSQTPSFLSPPIINNLDLTSSLHAPPINTMMAPSAGYKLAQDPMTGHLYIIPAANIADVLDGNRLWTSMTSMTGMTGMTGMTAGPLHHSLMSGLTQLSTGAQLHAAPLQSCDQPLNLHQNLNVKTSCVPVKTSPDHTMTNVAIPLAAESDTKPDLTAPAAGLPQQSADAQLYLNRPQGQCAVNFTFANLPLYYDSPCLVQQPPTSAVSDVSVTPKTEPISVQSRGTSPMTVTSGSPGPDDSNSSASDSSVVHVDVDQKHVITHNTSVQTSPDADQMNEMREQSSQTSETEKDSQSEAEEHCQVSKADVIDSDLEGKMESTEYRGRSAHQEDYASENHFVTIDTSCSVDHMKTLSRDPTSQLQAASLPAVSSPCSSVAMETGAPRRRHHDLQSLIRELMPLANGCDDAASAYSTKIISPLSVQISDHTQPGPSSLHDDRLIENSYLNLHSNLSTPSTPLRRWSELADTYQEENAVDGLSLLSSIVEKHSEEFRSPDSRHPSGSPRDMLSTTSWDRCAWSEHDRGMSPDYYRTYNSPFRVDLFSSTCSSPTYGATPKRDPLFSTSLENMDAGELEMRLKLAELQRKYREKQRELARLQPKRIDKDAHAKQRVRTSASFVDDWKKPRRRIKKRRHTTPVSSPAKLVDKKRRTTVLKLVSRRDLFLKTPMKINEPSSSSSPSSALGCGLSLLANCAANTTNHDLEMARDAEESHKRKLVMSDDDQTSAVRAKRKAGSPRKLSVDTRPADVPQKHSSMAPPSPLPPPCVSEDTYTYTSDGDGDKKSDQKSKTIAVDEWNIRRSERIFLNDASGTASSRYPGNFTNKASVNVKATGTVRTSAKDRKTKSKSDITKPNAESFDVKDNGVLTKAEANTTKSDHGITKAEADASELEGNISIAKEDITTPQYDADEISSKLESQEETLSGVSEVIGEVRSSLVEAANEQTGDDTGAEVTRTDLADIAPPLSRSTSVNSIDSTASDNLPLINLVADKTKPKQDVIALPSTPPCLLEPRDLVDGLRILLFMDYLFYQAQLRTIQPPDLYGVSIIGGRNNRPHIMTQEEILREAINDVRPTSDVHLTEGTRVCAYWSQKFRCLYPGTVASPDDNDDVTEQERDMIYVEFDDGDSGRIPFDYIRLLPHDFPLISETEKYPLLACQRTVATQPADLAPLEADVGPPPTSLDGPAASVADAAPESTSAVAVDDLRSLDEDQSKAKKKRERNARDKERRLKKKHRNKTDGDRSESLKKKHDKKRDINGKSLRKTKKESRENNTSGVNVSPSEQKNVKETTEATKATEDPRKSNVEELNKKAHKPKDRKSEVDILKKVKVRSPKHLEKKDDKKKEKRKNKHAEKKSEKKVNVLEETKESGVVSESCDVTDHKTASSSASKMAGNNLSFLPAQQLWRWSGKGTKRYGMKGKVRKTLYRAIIRDDEEIKVGDCAVFMSTGRPHLPYVGRIDCFWESWSGAMNVRVIWFYHPEETKTSKKLRDIHGALYESNHRDDNDVQTISHRCLVLPLQKYLKTEREIDGNDVYYLAGSYDPISGKILYQDGVE